MRGGLHGTGPLVPCGPCEVERAGRGAVIRQLLLESGVLAAAGGALGLVLAVGGNRLLVALRPTNLPRMESIALDLPVLAFTAAASLVAALLFGLFPALKVSYPALRNSCGTVVTPSGKLIAPSFDREDR